MDQPSKQAATFQPNWLPFVLGGLPHADVKSAWQSILTHVPRIPAWPQLPRHSNLENMYTQFSERFPGIVLQSGNIYVDRTQGIDADLERLYLAYLEDDVHYGQTSPSHAAGLASLIRGETTLEVVPVAFKGEVTGPVSWGLTVVDQNQRPLLYDDVLSDAVAKHLCLKASWQERQLKHFAPQTIIVVNEPYMASFGSSFLSLSHAQVSFLLNQVFAGIKGLKAVHCCGNTDWSLLLSTSVDIVSLDAYDYADALVKHAKAVAGFLQRGGIIAWGIVPASIASEAESVESLVSRLEASIDALSAAGIDRDAIIGAGMVTPSCGLGALRPQLADRVLELCSGVSAEMQRRYVVGRDRPESLAVS